MKNDLPEYRAEEAIKKITPSGNYAWVCVLYRFDIPVAEFFGGHAILTGIEAKEVSAKLNSHAAMVAAVKKCIECEEARQEKLLNGAPARTYTDARIAELKAALEIAGVK